MDMTKTRTTRDPRTDRTRHALVDAAIRLFGKYGFEHVTIRRIADEAGANLAAVNYHFGSKEGLREAAIAVVAEKLSENGPGSLIADFTPGQIRELSASQAQAVLRDIMISVLRNGSPLSEPAEMSAFVQRELFHPEDVSKTFYDSVFANHLDIMSHLVSRISGDPPDSDAARLKATLLVAQSVFLKTAQPLVNLAMGWEDYGDDELAQIGDAFWLSHDGP